MFTLASCFLCAFIVANLPAFLAGFPQMELQCSESIQTALQPVEDYMKETMSQLDRIEVKLKATQDRILAVQSGLESEIELSKTSSQNAFPEDYFKTKLDEFLQKMDLEASLKRYQEKMQDQLTAGLKEIQDKIEGQSIQTRKTRKAPHETISAKFQLIGKKFYHIEDKVKLNWIKAADTCRWMGGNLASIEDEAEMAAIKANVKRNTEYWLGIHSLNKECKFVSYATGNAATVLHWGNPRSFRCDKSVALVNNLMFDMSSYDKQFHFICEKK